MKSGSSWPTFQSMLVKSVSAAPNATSIHAGMRGRSARANSVIVKAVISA